ncbi:hypothetical protein ACFSO7_09825 [Bacillus sp. CGMCC 1.16607]|uniref:hypothetical protein n=1 Tax=Bacillus sp. CGMCC 1.16607 TaxID=3351842 RepID=UPI003625E7DD
MKFRKIILLVISILLIHSPVGFAEIDKNIEVFDIQKGKVIKAVPLQDEFQAEVKKYIAGIDHIYVKINPIPKKGYMIKIPLNPKVHIQNQWINTNSDQIILVFTKDEKPYLMVFDDKNHPLFFTFKGGNTDVLLRNLQINLNDL